jgi:hypothetical protein
LERGGERNKERRGEWMSEEERELIRLVGRKGKSPLLQVSNTLATFFFAPILLLSVPTSSSSFNLWRTSMSYTPLSSSPARGGSPLSLGAPIYPRHVELTTEQIAAKERRESIGLLPSIRPPSSGSEPSVNSFMVDISESSYLWCVKIDFMSPEKDKKRTNRFRNWIK